MPKDSLMNVGDKETWGLTDRNKQELWTTCQPTGISVLLATLHLGVEELTGL